MHNRSSSIRTRAPRVRARPVQGVQHPLGLDHGWSRPRGFSFVIENECHEPECTCAPCEAGRPAFLRPQAA